MKYLLLLFFSVLYLSAVGHASSVSGFVFDESDGESLTGANIFFEKISFGAISNNSGYYVVSDLPAGKYLLHCSYVGYRDYSKEIELEENQNFKLMIQLKPALMETEAVVVSADSVRTAVRLFRKAISRIDISPAEIKTMPAVAETDLLRMLQSLPGILPISDFSSKIYVRGGTSDQNLYLIDGADVYNPEHAFGLFSTFNTDAVKDIKISKGGFAAEYGGRLSSVLDVTNLDGNRKSFEGTAEISMLSAKTTVQMPIGKFGSVSASYRRTYIGETAKLFYEDIPEYYFYDGHVKAFFDINADNKLSVSFFKGDDFLDYAFASGTEGAPSIHYDWGNTTASLRWTHVFTPFLFSNFWITSSQFDSKFDVTEVGHSETNDLADLSFKGQLEYALSKSVDARFGFEYKSLQTSLQQDNPGGVVDVDRDREFYTGYVSLNWKPTPDWMITPGMRYNVFASDKTFQDWAPRFSAKYRLTENINLKASTGVYYQYLQKIPRPFIADIWTTSDKYHDRSKAVHYILGFQYEVAQNLSFELETYYKTYQNLYSLKNYFLDFEPSRYDESGRPVFTETKGLFDRGDGYSTGIELLLRKRYGSVNGWLAYSLARTEYTTEGINQENSYAPRHDRTHVVNAVINVDINNALREWQGKAPTSGKSNWKLGMNFVYTSGQPITLPSSTYYGAGIPDQDYEHLLLYPTAINRYRLPDYIRLDLSLTWKRRFKHWSMAPYLQIFNVGNRKNVWFVQYDSEETENQITQKVETFNMFPLLPTLGIRFEF